QFSRANRAQAGIKLARILKPAGRFDEGVVGGVQEQEIILHGQFFFPVENISLKSGQQRIARFPDEIEQGVVAFVGINLVAGEKKLVRARGLPVLGRVIPGFAQQVIDVGKGVEARAGDVAAGAVQQAQIVQIERRDQKTGQRIFVAVNQV